MATADTLARPHTAAGSYFDIVDIEAPFGNYITDINCPYPFASANHYIGEVSRFLALKVIYGFPTSLIQGESNDHWPVHY